MRLGFVSDIHIDINRDWAMASAIAEGSRALGLDRLYVVGDISNDAVLSISFVEKMKEQFGVETYLIPGNHDYYTFDESFGRMRHMFLNTFPHIVDGIGIMGDTGWYDYSWLRYGNVGLAMKGKTSDNGGTWPDHRFIKFPKVYGNSAKWLTDVCVNNLYRQNNILNAANVSERIVATHMVPNEMFIERDDYNSPSNCYFGSKALQSCIENIAPDFAFFGHTHTQHDKIVNGTHYICSPVGYMSYEHAQTKDALEFAIKHIVIYDTKERGIVG